MLQLLADHLKLRRPAILAAWRRLASSDPMLTTADRLTRVQFNDHIPGSLDALDRSLRRARDESNEVAAEHGSQRWQQGYGLVELVREFGHLHLCLMHELESFAKRTHPREPAMARGRELVALLIHNAVTNSVCRYYELQQAEAEGRLRALEAATAEFDHNEKARGDALRSASHDLRGGLAIVSNSASLLGKPELSDHLRAEAAARLQRGLGSLASMLTDLADLSRLEAGQEHRHLAPFDVARTLIDLGTTARAMADQKRLSLVLSGPDSLHVAGDEGKVRRIAQNLLINALKYTSEGGVTMQWENSCPETWELTVSDTGPGFASGSGVPLAEELEAVTEMSAREVEGAQEHRASVPQRAAASTQSERGEGIGLSIVKRLCEMLDAGLELESTPNKGSTFRIRFPCRYGANGG